MAILTFSEGAVLGGVQSWLQYRGIQAVCQPQEQFDLRALAQWLTPGVKAQAGDSVRYSAFLASGSAVIDYGGQWMNEQGTYGRYNRTLTVTSDASPVRTIQPANAGWYRDAAVSLQTAAITGQTLYVTQELGRTNGGSFVPYAMLAQGWLTSTAPVSSTTQPPPDGNGGGSGRGCCLTESVFFIADGTTSIAPALTIPAGKQARFTFIDDSLVTNAAIASRLVFLSIQDSTNSGFYIEASSAQPAATSKLYSFQVGGERRDLSASGVEYIPLPTDVWFRGTVFFDLGMSNPQPGDNWLTAQITYELRG